MVTYVMYCPIHTDHEMTTTKLIQRKTATKKEPLFECKICQKYYLYDKEADGKKIGTYGAAEVVGTTAKYTLRSDKMSPVSESIWKQDKKEPVGSGVGKTVAQNINADVTVRIKRVKDAETPKAKNNLANLRNEFPGIATDKMTVFDFIYKICGNLIDYTCVVRNASLNWKGNHVRKVEFYIKNSPYLKTKIPTDMFISFGGKISNGEFIVDEIRVLENPTLTNGWKEQKLRFTYDGPQHSNWFYNITETVAEPSKQLKGELKSWNDYLDWKRQLAELRIKGIKYIAVKVDIEERKVVFLSVAEGAEQAKEFRKFLNRNEISAFSNKYSKNRWTFEFNREYQDAQDSGVDLVFMEYGETYRGENAVRASVWSTIQTATRHYKDEKTNMSFGDKIRGIAQNYFEPQFQEVVFELTERASNLIRRDIRRNGSISENTEDAVAEEFYGDGYLATTQIGDFALLSRLQRAIDDLSSGKAAKQSLEKWLFDVKKADKPLKVEKIDTWQNSRINDSQKLAVEKIVSNPDVCLIQGPPGTGKTTVIAEAIYQLVIRNKRVLVASQANLAVDNALERLIANPKIRAIRLGNSKKIDDSVRNITEEYVLETFYDSIVDYIQGNFLDKWEEEDELEEKTRRDFEQYQSHKEIISGLAYEIESIQSEIQIMADETESEEYQIKHNAIMSEKMSAIMLGDFCDGKTSTIELMFGKDSILLVWNAIEDILHKLTDRGILLTKVGIDISSNAKITQSNRVVKHILNNARRVVSLAEQIKADTQFGGESEEIELLKLQEVELREKMMSDPSVVSEWQKVVAKIKELGQQGANLRESDMALFKDISQMEESSRRDYIKSVIETNLELIQQLLMITGAVSRDIVSRIETQLLDEEQREEQTQVLIANKKEDLLTKELLLKKEIQKAQLYLDKYDATDASLLEKINEYKVRRIQELKTSLRRSEWEGIFSGLRDWVEEIPDYSQEKDIFLRDFINGCNVVGVSCTENARTLTENGFDDFDVVIIDEVSKATPPELLIPMLRGRKIVLVGDHRQLPPLFNEHEKSYEEIAKQQEDQEDKIVPLTMADFEKYKDMVTASLFERHFETADTSIKETLTVQYRMHSDIMDLINLFYDGYLRDGNEDDYTEDTKAHYLSVYSTFGTEMIVPERHAYWFDSSQLAGERIFEQRKPQSSSCENLVEAETIIELLRKMENQYANMDRVKDPVSVGVISFYYDQVSMIRKMIQKESFHAIEVEVNTVDRFQGKEKEIIFVSLVRNVYHPKHNLDSYIAAFQRINVAFSRAQNLLVILGATDMYAEQPVQITDMNNGEAKIIYPYKQILEMMNTRGTYFTCDEVIPESRVDEILMSIARRGEEE